MKANEKCGCPSVHFKVHTCVLRVLKQELELLVHMTAEES